MPSFLYNCNDGPLEAYSNDNCFSCLKYFVCTWYKTFNNPILRDPKIFRKPNQFIPNRWNLELENLYNTVIFNQGPQKCPGLDISIFLIQSFIVHYLKYSGVLDGAATLNSQKIDTDNIPQMINPCSITFTIS